MILKGIVLFLISLLAIFWLYIVLGLITLSIVTIIDIVGTLMDLGSCAPCKYFSKRTKRIFEKIKDLSEILLDKSSFVYKKFCGI